MKTTILSSAISSLWESLFSKTAIMIYIIVILFLMLSIVGLMIMNELRRPDVIRDIEADNTKGVKQENSEFKPVEFIGGSFNGTSKSGKTKSEDDNNEDVRFFMLNKIDEEWADYKAPAIDKELTLKRVCEEFREFAGGHLGLFYDISDIRRFIAGLSITQIIILQGMSGTGKTSLAYAFGEYLSNPTTVVPIQPMWKERTDLIGYYNEFTNKFIETTLLQKLYEANYSEEIFITVLDEMNIARVEYYFAEFLSLLELPNPDVRFLDVVANVWPTDPKKLVEGRMKLPKNMWFIGTANNDDSTFAISDKVYDRAMVINLDKKAVPFESNRDRGMKITEENLRQLFKENLNKFEITDRNLRRIKELDDYMIKKFHLSFGNRIMKQIKNYVPVYVGCGGSEINALDDILSSKIMRKLESQNPVYMRKEAQGLCQYLDELFGVDQMPQCKDYITKIERNG
ncbi:MAG: AAA family ATPase [bacterium]